MEKEKFTIKDFNKKYQNNNACLQEIFKNRYKDKKNCFKCKNNFKVS